MARTLDRKKPFGEVFGNDPSIKHRYFQYGMKFDEEGNLVGPELPIPTGAENEAELRARLTKEIREQVQKEMREKNAEAAKEGGAVDVLAKIDAEQSNNRGGRPRRVE
jgi:hypothetical protein